MAAIQPFRDRRFTVTGSREPEQVEGARVTANAFDVLGVVPHVGQTFRPTHGLPGQNDVVVLGHAFWMRRFGGDASVVGQRMVLNGTPTEVIGVLPPHVQLPIVTADLILPLAWTSANEAERRVSQFAIVGRLAENTSIDEARTELRAIAGGLAQEYPSTNTGQSVVVEPLYDTIVGDVRSTLWTLFVAALLLLLLSSASSSNLLLARFASRRKEVALRAAAGATRGRIVRQLFTEAFVLSTLAGAIALVVAKYAVQALLLATPQTVYFTIPRRELIGLDVEVAGFAVLAMFVSGLVVTWPSARAASRADLNELLKEEAVATTAAGAQKTLRRLMVVGQIALGIVLVTGMVMAAKSYRNLKGTEPGFAPDGITVGQVTLPSSSDQSQSAIKGFFVSLTSELGREPSIADVSMISLAPMSGVASFWGFQVPGKPYASESEWPSAQHSIVASNYFDVMGIRLRRGRAFNAFDNEVGEPVAIVNETLARRFFAGLDPIGQHITINDRGRNPRAVIGVVADVRFQGLLREPPPQVYVPFEQLPLPTMTIVAKAQDGSTDVPRAIRAAVGRVNPTLAVAGMSSLTDMVRNAGVRFSTPALVLAGLGVAAVIISVFAVYGMVAHAARQREQEVGIRLALGASRGAIVMTLLRETLFLGTAGAATGLLAAWMLGTYLQATLFAVEVRDPLTFVVVGLAAVSACAGCALEAIVRGVRRDPVSLLRAK